MSLGRISIRQIAGATLMAVLLMGPCGTSASAGIVDNIGKRVQTLEDGLCQRLKSPKCRQGKAVTKKAPPLAAASAAKKQADETKSAIPIPRPNPRRMAAEVETPGDIPIPRAKPAGIGTTQQDPLPISQEREVASIAPPPKKNATLSRNGDCHDSLAFMGVSFRTVAQPASAGSCSVDDPVVLTSMRLSSGTVEFPDQPMVNCRFAIEFSKWLEADGIAAAAKAGSPLAKLHTGPGYECRGRNGDASGKISEHGYGNAVDITFFKLRDGSTIQVKDAPVRTAKGYAALAAMRSTACSRFTTVLGPGSNAAHAEHFHFDLGKHGKSGTYRICE